MAGFALPGFVLANAVAQSTGVKGSAATRIGMVGGLFGTSPVGILVARQMALAEAKKRPQPEPPKDKPPAVARANNGLTAETVSDTPPSASQASSGPAKRS